LHPSSLSLLLLPRPPLSTLFPYTTLFRSMIAAFRRLTLAGTGSRNRRRPLTRRFLQQPVGLRGRRRKCLRRGAPAHGRLLDGLGKQALYANRVEVDGPLRLRVLHLLDEGRLVRIVAKEPLEFLHFDDRLAHR